MNTNSNLKFSSAFPLPTKKKKPNPGQFILIVRKGRRGKPEKADGMCGQS